MAPKNIHKIFIPPKNIHFSQNHQNIEIQNFEPPKNSPGLRMCENIRVPPPPLWAPHLTQGLGSKGQNSTFSEHGHFAYQIKGNHEMQQHSSKYFARRPSPHPPTTLGDGVKRFKFNFFRTWLCCRSNLRESRTTLI